MSKIIIHIKDDISEEDALGAVSAVVSHGRISKGNKKDHYCWHSCFKSGMCVSTQIKYRTDSDIFIVHRGQSK